MSIHSKPLTELEEIGMLAHGLGESIGKPSRSADLFRLGISWALMSEEKRNESVRTMLKHNIPINPVLRQRLADLLRAREAIS